MVEPTTICENPADFLIIDKIAKAMAGGTASLSTDELRVPDGKPIEHASLAYTAAQRHGSTDEQRLSADRAGNR